VYVLSDGKFIEGRWQREFSLFPFEFVDLDGNQIELSPGNTWIELTAAIPTADLSDATIPAEIWPAP
jgi:hypothetical protein